jgi:hypothetical protein
LRITDFHFIALGTRARRMTVSEMLERQTSFQFLKMAS